MRETQPLKGAIVTLLVVMCPCIVILRVFLLTEAHALPQFTRQYELKCNKCHLAPPTLNFTGRRFLQNGYRFFRQERDQKTFSDGLTLDSSFPLGIWVSSQPFERNNEVDQIRPFHDARLYIGGGIYRDISAFMRWDLEEEKAYRFSSQLATLSYNPTDLFNAHISWTSISFHNITDTLHSSRQLTLKQNSVLSQSFGGADNNGTLSSPRQGIHVSGWLTNSLFYTLGYSSHAHETDFGKLSTLSERLAFEILPLTGYDSFTITMGAFGIHGFNKNTKSRRFDRLAGDLQVDIPLIFSPLPGIARLMGSYLWATDEQRSGSLSHNHAWYVQGAYATMAKGDPKWVPIIRLDEYTKNDRHEVFRELTLNLTYYFVENFRAHLEHWRQIDVPSGSDKDHSVLVRLVYLY